MTTIIFIICAMAWLAIGASGFIYWFTKDYDITTSEMPLLLGASLIGIISWIAGYYIHGRGSSNVILRKREPKPRVKP